MIQIILACFRLAVCTRLVPDERHGGNKSGIHLSTLSIAARKSWHRGRMLGCSDARALGAQPRASPACFSYRFSLTLFPSVLREEGDSLDFTQLEPVARRWSPRLARVLFLSVLTHVVPL